MVETLHHLSEVTDRVVAQALDPDTSDAPVVHEPTALIARRTNRAIGA